MIVLLAIGIIVGIAEIARASQAARAESRHRREIERLKLEQARRSAESARYREEWRRQKAETLEMLTRQRKLEAEQERQAREQARQAEQLARHEEQIAQLEFRMTQAEADIAAESERIASLYALMDIAAAEQTAAVPGSKTDIRAQKQIISYQTAIHAAEKRKAKAVFTKQAAQQKLSA